MKAVVGCLACAMLVTSALAHAQSEPSVAPKAADAPKPSQPKAKHPKKAHSASPPTAAAAPAKPTTDAKPNPDAAPSVAVTKVTPQQPASDAPKRACTLADAEQPRGGRLEVLSDTFGTSPVVRIAGKPARMIERREDRVSVQVPADSNGGPITLLHDGRNSTCGNLIIIGKNR